MASSKTLQEKLQFLYDYDGCDISDALLRLEKTAPGQVPRAGYLADILPFALGSAKNPEDHPKIIAPAATMKLTDRSPHPSSTFPAGGKPVPAGSHWADMTEPDTVFVIEQVKGQYCASIGGIMASRMTVNKVKACVVGGRVRDIGELKKSGLPVFAEGKSTVSSGAETKVWALNVPVSIAGVTVNPGDIMFCDPVEGIVAIPQNLLDEVIDLLPQIIPTDDKVKDSVEKGMPVAEAIKKFRGGRDG